MLNLWQNKRKGDCPFFLILWFYGCNSMINALVYPFFGGCPKPDLSTMHSQRFYGHTQTESTAASSAFRLIPSGERFKKYVPLTQVRYFFPYPLYRFCILHPSVTLTFVPTSLYTRALLRILVITLVIWLLSSSMESSFIWNLISSSMPFSSKSVIHHGNDFPGSNSHTSVFSSLCSVKPSLSILIYSKSIVTSSLIRMDLA